MTHVVSSFVRAAGGALLCSALLTGVVSAQHASWEADERVLISDFAHITALASDNGMVFAVTPNGMLVYDASSRTFRLPLTLEDGYPVEERPLSITWARAEFALMIGTARGGIFTLATLSPRFDGITRLPAPVLRLVSPSDGFDVFAETPEGWFRLRAGSFRPEPARPPAPEPQTGSADTYLRSMLGAAGQEPGRPAAPVSAVEQGGTQGVYIAGTLGNGLVELDTRTLERTRLPFGLNTRGVNAIAEWAGSMWFGGDGSAVNGSLVSASRDLTKFFEHSPRSGAPRTAVTALLAIEPALWVGTTDGLSVLERTPAGPQRWHDFGSVIREPVLSLASAASSVFVGTRSGAWAIRGGISGGPAGRSAEAVLTGAAVHGMTAQGDTLWIASDAGLAALPLTGTQVRTTLLRDGTVPAGPVLDVAASGDTLYVVTGDALYRRSGTGWSAAEQIPAGVIGPLLTVRADGESLLLTGVRGAAKAHARGAGWDYYVAPADVPEGPVRQVLAVPGHLWLATPAGAMRIIDRR